MRVKITLGCLNVNFFCKALFKVVKGVPIYVVKGREKERERGEEREEKKKIGKREKKEI